MSNEYTWEIEPYKIIDVLELIESKKLILRPEYQRRAVWSKPAKSSLIETVIQNKPIPLFLIQEKQNGNLEVIDGQQRLRSLNEFYNNELKLINVVDEIKGKVYSDFEDTLFPESSYKNIFDNYKLYFNLVRNANEDDIIDMYSRVNKYTVNLNKMEMRYALSHNTEIMKFIESLIEKEEILEFFLKSGVFTQSGIDRMGDIEFFTQLISYILNKEFMNKNDSITDLFSNYSEMEQDKKDEITSSFNTILEILKLFFSGEEFKYYNELEDDADSIYYLKNSRFKQKNDFLSLFCTLYTLNKELNFLSLDSSKLSSIRYFLIFMDSEVAPQSDIKVTAEYGTKCVSQANTKTSREFRSKFIIEGFNYIFENDFYNLFNFSINASTKEVNKLNLIENLILDVNKLYNFSLNRNSQNIFKDVLEFLWEE